MDRSNDENLRDEYGTSYSQEDTDRLSMRRAEDSAAFLIPYLQPGMTLLDCGCGPGTITADLAEIVSPAQCVGIDPEEKQIQTAKRYWVARKRANLAFKVGSVYDLPFAPSSFDVVFMHAVCEHLSDVSRAFAEVQRVLKPGGIFGVRSGDLGASMLWPEDGKLSLFLEVFEGVYRHHGRHSNFGRRQLSVLRQAGFKRIVVSASYDCWCKTEASKTALAKAVQKVCLDSWVAEQAEALGIADRRTLAEVAEAWSEWAGNPEAFMAEARAEAVAWKE